MAKFRSGESRFKGKGGRFGQTDADPLLFSAELTLQQLEIDVMIVPTPAYRKRVFALILLMELLTKIMVSRATSMKIVRITGHILRAFFLSVGPLGAPVMALPRLSPLVLQLLAYRFSEPDKKEIRKAVISWMTEETPGVSPDTISKERIEEAILTVIETSLDESKRDRESDIPIKIADVKAVLAKAEVDREGNWAQTAIVMALEALISVLSLRSSKPELDDKWLEWRISTTPQVIQIILSVAMPEITMPARNLDLLTDHLTAVREVQMGRRSLAQKPIITSIRTATSCFVADLDEWQL